MKRNTPCRRPFSCVFTIRSSRSDPIHNAIVLGTPYVHYAHVDTSMMAVVSIPLPTGRGQRIVNKNTTSGSGSALYSPCILQPRETLHVLKVLHARRRTFFKALRTGREAEIIVEWNGITASGGSVVRRAVVSQQRSVDATVCGHRIACIECNNRWYAFAICRCTRKKKCFKTVRHQLNPHPSAELCFPSEAAQWRP